jgi:hypothetical protein
MQRSPRFVLLTVLAVSFLMAACAGGPIVKTEGSYGRVSQGTWEQKTADALRREGASDAAKEAQRRADSTAESERKDPVSAFFAGLLNGLFGAFLDVKTTERPTTK